jgi:hypothetical protein
MKAICIKNSRNVTSSIGFKGESKLDKFDLTIGKVYEIILLPEYAPNILPKKCKVIDDFRKNIHAPFDFFKPIEEYRDEQIEEILK